MDNMIKSVANDWGPITSIELVSRECNAIEAV